MKNKKLTELMLHWDSRAIAEKMLKKAAESTPQEIGRMILGTKIKRQFIVNLEPKN